MTSSQSLTGRTSVIVKVVAFLVLGFVIGLTVFVVLKKKGPLGRETGGVSSVAPTPKTIDQGANVPAQAAAQEKEFPATNGFGGFRSSGNGPSAAVVPSGASIKVKLNTTVGEDTEEGDTFVASLTEPLVMDGKTILPAGTVVEGSVVRAVPLDISHESAVLSLRLKSVSINGKKYPVEAALSGRVKRNTRVIGGAAGALIGGLAGGGKGATIGAAAGTSGSGTRAVKGGTAGKAGIVLPAGTGLSFKLERPLDLRHEPNRDPHD